MAASRKRLIAACVCGLLAALLLIFYANNVRAQAESSRSQALADYGGEQVEVLVATRDIAAGERLDASNVSYQIWLVDLLPSGVARDTADVFGKTAAIPILKNEPIVAIKLGEGSAQIVVPDGLCAVSIPADDVQAIGGALTPGMMVDIYMVNATKVTLVAQNVLVLETSNGYGVTSTGNGSSSLFSGSSGRAALKWVTVAVDAQTVQELLIAARERSLSLVLPGGGVERVSPNENTSSAGSFLTPPVNNTTGTGSTQKPPANDTTGTGAASLPSGSNTTGSSSAPSSSSSNASNTAGGQS